MRSADAERRRGQYENALRCYCRALAQDALLPLAWLGQGQMLVLLEEVAEAGFWCRRALEFFPANGDLMAAQSQSACRQGNLSKALALSDASLAARGESAYRWLCRGEI